MLMIDQSSTRSQSLHPLPYLLKPLASFHMPLTTNTPRLSYRFILPHALQIAPEPARTASCQPGRIAYSSQPSRADHQPRLGLLLARLEVLKHGVVERMISLEVCPKRLGVQLP